jgi:hypothetical protein
MAKTSTIVSAAVRSRLPTPGLIIFKETSQAKVAGPTDVGPRTPSQGVSYRAADRTVYGKECSEELRCRSLESFSDRPSMSGSEANRMHAINLRPFYVLRSECHLGTISFCRAVFRK